MKTLLNVFVCGIVALLFAGCETQPAPVAPPSAPTPTTGAHEDHDHGAGPHDGTIGEFGGGRHIEFMVDHGKQEATVYILGEDAKSPAPIKADKLTLSLTEPATQIELAAQPLEGEADGMSSRFVGKHESLAKEQEFAGSVTVEIEGTPFSGDFKEEPGHEHKH